MDNNRLSGAYAHHLTNMKSPNSRCDEAQDSEMPILTPQTRLPPFRNFIRPIPNTSGPDRQAMDLDQAEEVPQNPSQIQPDGKEDDDSTLIDVQESNGFSRNKNTFDIRGGPSSMTKIGSSTQVRVDNGELATTSPTPMTEVEVTKPRGSSAADASLYPSNPTSADGDVNMIDSLIHGIAEVQPSEVAEGHSTPPLYALSDDGSTSPAMQETRDKVKKSKERMQVTLKKALERALVRRNRSSSQQIAQAPGAAQDLPTGHTNDSITVDRPTKIPLGDSSNPAFYPQELPRRRLLGQAGRIAMHTVRLARTSFGHRGPRSDSAKAGKKQLTPADPVLAASLDAMAREYASATKTSSAIPSAFKKLTGKRHRDIDHLLRRADLASIRSGDKPDRQDTARCTKGCQNDGVIEIKEVQDGSKAHLQSWKGQFKGGSGRQASGTPLVPVRKCQNDLDFLASVVLSQEFPDHKEGMGAKKPGHPTGPSSVTNQGDMNQYDVNVVQSAPASLEMSVNRLLGTNANGTQINALNISDQASTHIAQGDDHQVTHFGVATIVNTGEAAAHIALGGQNVPQTPNYNEEPKSEASYIGEESSASRAQQMQPQTFQNSAHHLTEESAPDAEDAVAPNIQVASRHVHIDEISPVRQGSSSQVQQSLDMRSNIRSAPSQMMEVMDEIVPAARAISLLNKSCQTTPMMAHPGSSSEEITRSKNLNPSYMHDEDQITPAPVHPQDYQPPRPGPSSLTQVAFSKAPKLSVRRRLYEDMDEAAPVPQHSQTLGISPGPSSSGQAGSSKDGKRPVHRTIDEDVSEITPAPPRAQRSASNQAGPSSQTQTLANGAGSSAQGGTQGAAPRNRSSRSRATTTLPYKFGCDVCGAMFNRRFNLNKHIRNVHHNIRKFKCSMCEERFLQKSHRAAHLLAVHHKLRPFVCHLCTKNFSWLGVLRKHLQAIHKVPVQVTKRARRARATRAAKMHQVSHKVQPLPSRDQNIPPVSPHSGKTSPPPSPSHDKRHSK